jgi:hypothetical protein
MSKSTLKLPFSIVISSNGSVFLLINHVYESKPEVQKYTAFLV